MRRSCVVAMACVLAIAGFAVSQQSANLSVGFTKLETELYEAIKQKDVSRLDQLLAPDYVLVTSARAGDPMDRKSWLDLIAVYNVESFTSGKSWSVAWSRAPRQVRHVTLLPLASLPLKRPRLAGRIAAV